MLYPLKSIANIVLKFVPEYGDEMAKLQSYPAVGLPYCAGYACGYHLVKHYLKKTGKSIVEATLLPVSEILEVAEDFWNE